MSNTNFQTFHQMGSAINSVVRQATGRDNVQNINMDYVTVAQQRRLVEEIITGNPVTINANVPGLLNYLHLIINPVQDLHGYSYPWVGGAGNNLMYLNSSYASQDTVTYSPDPATGVLTLGGTAPSIMANRNLREIPVVAGEKYFISGTPENGGSTTSCVRYVFRDAPSGSAIGSVTDVESGGVVVTAPEGATIISIYAHTSTGTDPNGMILKPFVARSDMEMSFEPYENICPITGWTEATITRNNRNLFDAQSLTLLYRSPNTADIETTPDGNGIIINRTMGSTGFMYAYINFKTITESDVGKTYTLSCVPTGFTPSHRYKLAVCSRNMVNRLDKTETYTITESDINKYLAIKLYGDYGTGSVAEYDNVQIEYGDTATGFVPYETVYTVEFPSEAGTVYGGELSIDNSGNGTLVVNKKCVAGNTVRWVKHNSYNCFSSSFTDKKPGTGYVSGTGVLDGSLISDSYVVRYETLAELINGTIRGHASNTTIYIRDDRYVDATAFNEYASNFNICYELAEPITYSLTAQQVELLMGTNTLTADTGDLTVIYKYYEEVI